MQRMSLISQFSLTSHLKSMSAGGVCLSMMQQSWSPTCTFTGWTCPWSMAQPQYRPRSSLLKPPSILSSMRQGSSWLKTTMCALWSIHSTETMVFLHRQMRSVRKAGTGSEQEGRRRPQAASPSRTAMQWKWRLRSVETDFSQYLRTWRPSCWALTSSRSAGKGGVMAAGEECVSMEAQWSPLRTIFLEQSCRAMSGARERVSWKALCVWEELMSRCGSPWAVAAASRMVRRISLLNIQIIQYTLDHFQKPFLAAHPTHAQNTHHPHSQYIRHKNPPSRYSPLILSHYNHPFSSHSPIPILTRSRTPICLAPYNLVAS